MIYYTIYVKGLQNSTGYIDVALADDQLLKDYLQFLDIGIRPNRAYVIKNSPGGAEKHIANTGTFAINLSDVTALTALRSTSPGS